MKIEITARKSNPLLAREEIEFTVKEITSTPKTDELRAKIASMTESDPETTVITEIKQNFGEKSVTGKARSYKEKKRMKQIELEYIIGRNFSEEKTRIKKIKDDKKAEKEKKKLESKKKKK